MSELAEHGLVPASTIFVPLPTSDLHFLVVRITPDGVVFELLRIARVPAENGIGLKLAVKDREPMDLNRLRQRRLAADRKRKAPGQDLVPETTKPQAFG
jgi:mediator of RNA polymerase II transcription subunit 14